MGTPEQQQLLKARYGDQSVPADMLWNDQVERLLEHRSVRSYLPQPLPAGSLESIVAAAQSASTSSNLHQWSVIAVTDSAIKEELAHLARSTYAGIQQHILEAPAVLLWVADLSRNYEITSASGTAPDAYDYVDSFLTAAIDTALAAQNGAVAAEALGLGVCYLGLMRNRAREVAELVHLPKFSFVAFGMCVGIPDPERPGAVRPRLRQDVVLHHDRYSAERPTAWIDNYEATFEEFRRSAGAGSKTWVEAVCFASTMPYLDGRDNLRQAFEEYGYRLR